MTSITADGGKPARPRRVLVADAALLTKRERFWMAFTGMTGVMITVMATTIVNVAVPDIMGAFGIGQDQVHWISTGFLAAMLLGMMMNAWFLSNVGPRDTVAAAMAIFSICSVIAQMTPSFSVMIACRIVQGACAGILQPLSMALTFKIFPPESRGAAMGLFGMGVVIGPAIGPVVGGMIVDIGDWRNLFIVTLPVTLANIVMAQVFLPGRDPNAPAVKLNWLSFCLFAGMVGAFLMAVSDGQRMGWGSDYIIALFSLSVSCLVGLVWVEWTTERPLIHAGLFAHRTFVMTIVVAFVVGIGLFGSLYVIPVFVREIQHMNATNAGWLLFPSGLAMLSIFPFAGRIAQNYPAGYPIICGLTCFFVSSFFLTAADAHSGFWWLAAWAALGRMGIGLIFPSLNFGGLAALPPHLLPYGTSMINMSRQLGGAVGVAAVAIYIEQRTQRHIEQLNATQTEANSVTMEIVTRVDAMIRVTGLPDLERLDLSHLYLQRIVSGQAAALAYQDSFWALTAVFILCVIPALFLLRRPQTQAGPPSSPPSMPPPAGKR